MSYEHMSYELRDGVARITFNRPKAYNAITLDACRELCDIVNRASSDKAVRVVVLSGAGEKAFCAGGDVAGFAAAGDGVELLVKQMTGYLHMAVSRLAWMDAPVIAAVNGVAAGAGLSLVSACDLAIASDRATFTSAYASVGLTPDGSSTWFLPRLIGRRRTLELMLSPRVLSAAEALEWGLVNRVVAAAELAAEVDRVAVQIAAGSTAAYGAAKRLVMLSEGDSLESQMERETRAIAASASSPDGREGAQAFVGKRKPMFAGAAAAAVPGADPS